MWARLSVAIWKEMVSYLQDPTTRRFLIGAPIVQTVLFAFSATLDVQNIDVAVLDQDTGRWSHELVERVDAAWFTDEIISARDSRELEELITAREALVALHLAPDFSRRIDAGLPASVQVVVDGRRANAGQVATSYLATVVGELGAALVPASALQQPLLEERHWFNPNRNYRWFMVANLSGVLGMMMCLVVTSLSIAREREMGTFDQLLVSPISATEIIIAKTMPGMMAGFVVSLIITLLAVFAFGAPYTGQLLLFPFSLSLFVLSVVGMGLLISSLCNTQQQAIMGSFFSSIPFVLTSGFATPVENMPEWLQWGAELNPLKHYLVVVQGSFFKSHGLADVVANIWPLLPLALASLAIASIEVRSKLG
jgi:ABC-2 type transport system permease protein